MTDFQQARELYNLAFGEDKPFDDLLFADFFEYCHTLFEGDRLVSMLFLLPCELCFEDKILPVQYIYAAATQPDQRGKGHMGRLLDQIKRQESIFLLRPATDKLVDYYKRQGFTPFNAEARLSGVPFVRVEDRLCRLAEGGDNSGERFIMMCSGIDSSQLENLGCAFTML